MKGALFRIRWLIPAVVALLLGGCAETELIVHAAKQVTHTQPAPSHGVYKVGSPYRIGGTWYYPAENYEYDETGIASWYGPAFHGRYTANGETFDMNALTAAHRTLPLPSIVRVTNLENGRSVILRVNDRGPFARGRIIDVSRRAAQLLGFAKNGTARVRVKIMTHESRVAAARLQGKAELAEIGTPITVDRLPKPVVSAEVLPPPPGTVSSPPPAPTTLQLARQTAATPSADDGVSRPEVAPASGVPGTLQPQAAVVSVGPVKETRLFVQAGAYSQFENANRVRARLTGIGEVKVRAAMVGGRDLFRVRVGPLTTVHAADDVLQAVLDAGYNDARIVVD